MFEKASAFNVYDELVKIEAISRFIATCI